MKISRVILICVWAGALFGATAACRAAQGGTSTRPAEAISKPSVDVTLSFARPGLISKILVKEGDAVKANQTLVQQDDGPEMEQLESLKADADDDVKIRAAIEQLKQKKVDLERMLEAKKKNVATDLDVDHARLDVTIADMSLELAKFQHSQDGRKYRGAKLEMERMKILSPIDGKVQKIFQQAGEVPEAHTKIIRVVKLDPLWVDVPMPITQAATMQIGRQATVSFPAYDKANPQPQTGKVIFIAPIEESASQTVTVRVEVPNPNQRRAGERVSVEFLSTMVPVAAATTEPRATAAPSAAVPQRAGSVSDGATGATTEPTCKLTPAAINEEPGVPILSNIPVISPLFAPARHSPAATTQATTAPARAEPAVNGKRSFQPRADIMGMAGEEAATQPAVTGEHANASKAIGQIRCFAIELHGADQPWDTYIDEIAKTGANSVSLYVTGLQENAASTYIAIDARKIPSDARLKELIAHAHKKKLRVLLMPILLLEAPREGEWRGMINPGEGTKWAKWWENYQDFIVHYAKIAQETNTEVFFVGSELMSTEDQEKQWRKVIHATRGVYKGLLSYSANWDHYKSVNFWDDLDMIGMTTFYDLTSGDKPTLERLAKGWEPIKKNILDWRTESNPTKPLLFTEVGWPNQVTCAQFPWDYYRSPDQPDTEAQANCFEAFFRAWGDEKNVAGMLVWEWRNYPGQKIGPTDTSYVPCEKPAMKVIEKYFASPTPTITLAADSTTKPAATPVEEKELIIK